MGLVVMRCTWCTWVNVMYVVYMVHVGAYDGRTDNTWSTKGGAGATTDAGPPATATERLRLERARTFGTKLVPGFEPVLSQVYYTDEDEDVARLGRRHLSLEPRPVAHAARDAYVVRRPGHGGRRSKAFDQSVHSGSIDPGRPALPSQRDDRMGSSLAEWAAHALLSACHQPTTDELSAATPHSRAYRTWASYCPALPNSSSSTRGHRLAGFLKRVIDSRCMYLKIRSNLIV